MREGMAGWLSARPSEIPIYFRFYDVAASQSFTPDFRALSIVSDQLLIALQLPHYFIIPLTEMGTSQPVEVKFGGKYIVREFDFANHPLLDRQNSDSNILAVKYPRKIPVS